MKTQKIIYTVAIIFISLASYSQLKVLSNGKLVVGGGTLYNAGRLNISDTDNSTIFSKCYLSFSWGDAIKSEVNRSDGIAFAGYYNDTRYFMVFGNGEVRCVDLYETSDSALKENVATIATALEKVKQLRGVSYQLKADEGVKKDKIGLIAQEVEKIVPEVIQTSPEGQKAISYSKLVALLIEAVKEQQQTIEEQNERIEYIEANCCNIDSEKSATISTGTGGVLNSSGAKLYQNSPNPFSTKTTIRFEIPEAVGNAQLYICNMTGTLLKTLNIAQRGAGSLTINGNELNAGMYLYSLVTDGKIADTKQMLLTE